MANWIDEALATSDGFGEHRAIGRQLVPNEDVMANELVANLETWASLPMSTADWTGGLLGDPVESVATGVEMEKSVFC